MEEATDGYYLIHDDRYWLCYIPIVDFDKYFLKTSENTCRENPHYEWHPMSGGFDTYLQSYCLNHARSIFKDGIESYPIVIRGSYYFTY